MLHCTGAHGNLAVVLNILFFSSYQNWISKCLEIHSKNYQVLKNVKYIL